MRRSWSLAWIALALAAGCTWPPQPSVPNPPNPDQTVQQQTNGLPQSRTAVPDVSPPAASLPSTGGLLHR